MTLPGYTQFLVAACAVIFGGITADAQEMRPLDDVVQGNHETSYPLVRCAAIYQSAVEWAGKNRAGDEVVQAADASIKNLLSFAALIRSQKTDTTIQKQVPGVLEDTRAIADLYLERYRANYSTSGAAWENDALWLSDWRLCNEISQGISERVK